jgi:hypothetical protein
MSQIETLVDISEKIQALRQYPAQLLRAPSTGESGILVDDLGPSVDLGSVGLSLSPPEQLRRHFRELKQFAESIKSESVQAALQTAHQSKGSLKGPVAADVRKEQRMRR